MDPSQAVHVFDKLGETGGILGYIIGVLFIQTLIGLGVFIWFVKTDRRYKKEQDIRHNAQYEKRLEAEERLRSSMERTSDRTANAILELAIAIRSRPCMKGNTDRIIKASKATGHNDEDSPTPQDADETQ